MASLTFCVMSVLKRTFLLSLVMWLLGFVLGMYLQFIFSSLNSYNSNLDSFILRDLLSLSFRILYNNLYVIIYSLTGIFLFGISTAFNLVYNGFSLGRW